MISKLAVIIAGEYRTWELCYKHLFRMFESRAKEVDYYFVTWNRTAFSKRRESEIRYVTDEDVIRYFDDKNKLIRFKIVNTNDCNNSHSYVRKAYLSKIGNILKREVELENSFVYDQVVDTRPDIYFRDPHHKHPFTPLYDFQLVLGDEDVQNFVPFVTDQGYLHISDIYQRTTSLTHDVISARILDIQSDLNIAFRNTIFSGHTHHHLLSNYLLNRGIVPYYVPDYEFYVPIRYNISADIDLDQWPYDHLNELCRAADKYRS